MNAGRRICRDAIGSILGSILETMNEDYGITLPLHFAEGAIILTMANISGGFSLARNETRKTLCTADTTYTRTFESQVSLSLRQHCVTGNIFERISNVHLGCQSYFSGVFLTPGFTSSCRRVSDTDRCKNVNKHRADEFLYKYFRRCVLISATERKEKNRERSAEESPFKWQAANGNKKLTELSRFSCALTKVLRNNSSTKISLAMETATLHVDVSRGCLPLLAPPGENPFFEIQRAEPCGFVFPRFQRTEKKHAGVAEV